MQRLKVGFILASVAGRRAVRKRRDFTTLRDCEISGKLAGVLVVKLSNIVDQ